MAPTWVAGQTLWAAALPRRRSIAASARRGIAEPPASTAADDIHSAASWSAPPTFSRPRRSRFHRSSAPVRYRKGVHPGRAIHDQALHISPYEAWGTL